MERRKAAITLDRLDPEPKQISVFNFRMCTPQNIGDNRAR